MTITDTFSKICNLESIEMRAGEYFVIEITVTNENGSPADLSSGISRGISFAYYGLYDELLYKSGTISGAGNNVMTCNLEEADTEDWIPGKILYQPIFVDSNNKPFKPGQGIITLLPAIR